MAYTKDSSRRAIYDYQCRVKETGYYLRVPLNMKVERTRTGDKNPSWRQQVANHVNATTAMSGTFESIDSTPSSSTRVSYTVFPGIDIAPYDTASVTGYVAAVRGLPGTDTHTNPTIDASGALYSAYSKAFKQIRKSQISMSGGVFLGEMREAIHMLRHPATALRSHLSDYLRKLGKAKKRNPKKWMNTLSQTWLESSFGWRPFLNDIEDAMSAYDEVTKKAGIQYSKIRAVGKSQKSISGPTNDTFNAFSNVAFKGVSKVHEECFAVIRGEVKREAITTAVDKARCFGLTPSEFMPTVWELLPWSFLVDYFTNIGDIIENSVTDTSNVTWLEQSIVKDRITTYQCEIDVAQNKINAGWRYKSCYGSQSTLKYRRRTVSRSPNVTLTVPPLTFEIPGSEIKELNMLALFTQATSIHQQDTSKLRGRTFR